MNLLEVKNLELTLESSKGRVDAVRDISFSVNKGEIVAIVGESGCGKTMTCLSILNLFLKDNGHIEKTSSILFEGEEIARGSEKTMQKIRGARIGVIFQNSMKALNPTEKIGEQIVDILREHKKISRKEAKKEAIDLLKKVGINQPDKRYKQYPHELSGGMCQRVVIAIATACKPSLLIADEPTTALDVTTQAQILEMLKDLQEKSQMAVLLVTHDLGIVASIADRILVMYGGKILEEGSVIDIFKNPQHPYTRALLNLIPKETERRARFETIPGTPPDLINPPKGCPFFHRCKKSMQICSQRFPSDLEIVGLQTSGKRVDSREDKGTRQSRSYCWLNSLEYHNYCGGGD